MIKSGFRCIPFLLLCGFNIACSQQLGPKDGLELPPNDLDRIKIGEAAPDFTLEDVNGRPISLSDFRGRKFVVLVFYRGHW